ncbi:hypothetical protein HDU77_006330 [Chytriomyces hyalinus]|nr:hypothetical protein HDU77_006330 [Chytriomyces hyalinus]
MSEPWKLDPKWEGAKATKCFVESGSLMPKILRNILWSYVTKCGHSADVLKRLVIPGILIYGEAFRLIELDSIGGYVTRIRMNAWKIMNLNGGVKPLMDLFLDIFLVRVLVLKNNEVVAAVSNCEEDKEDFLENLQQQKIGGITSANKWTLDSVMLPSLTDKALLKFCVVPAAGAENNVAPNLPLLKRK